MHVSLTNTKGWKMKTTNILRFLSRQHLIIRMLNCLHSSIPLYTLKETKMIVNALNLQCILTTTAV